jgi:hypothetical protein
LLRCIGSLPLAIKIARYFQMLLSYHHFTRIIFP